MKIYKDLYWFIISPQTLFHAWDIFKSDKRSRPDVVNFELNLEKNIFNLYRCLKNKTYTHGPYRGFWIHDPKVRRVHKATVVDRVLHHAIFQILNPIFEPTFIAFSFSCRVGKGTHKGVDATRGMLQKESRNNTRQCYVLKCDIRKFFDSIDHRILLSILERRIRDPDTVWLLRNIIGSYESNRSILWDKKGVPIGNLTSQLFANVYMNEFDQFIKHTLKVRFYARYTDDFVIVSKDKEYLNNLLPEINQFLQQHLALDLHPHKVEILSYTKGIDFLGYVIFPHHTLVRKKTKQRMLWKFKDQMNHYRCGRVEKERVEASLRSYLGVLSHANAHNFSVNLRNYFWFMRN